MEVAILQYLQWRIDPTITSGIASLRDSTLLHARATSMP
jgi:hypothetical protein